MIKKKNLHTCDDSRFYNTTHKLLNPYLERITNLRQGMICKESSFYFIDFYKVFLWQLANILIKRTLKIEKKKVEENYQFVLYMNVPIPHTIEKQW